MPTRNKDLAKCSSSRQRRSSTLNATAVSGEHYDEIFIATDAITCARNRKHEARHADVFPAIPEMRKVDPDAPDTSWCRHFVPPYISGEGHSKTFSNKVFSDHLLVHIDVEFPPDTISLYVEKLLFSLVF